MLLDKLSDIIEKVKVDIGNIADLIPEDKKKIIRELIIKAVLAYGEAQINKAMKDD